jgi:hypothetical protein
MVQRRTTVLPAPATKQCNKVVNEIALAFASLSTHDEIMNESEQVYLI